MYLHQELADAATELAGLVGNVKPDQLAASTPCTGYDLRRLVNHLLYWSPIIESVGLYKSATPDRPDDGSVDLSQGDWQSLYLDWLRRITAAWQPESAWDGSATVGGRTVPAAIIGEKTLVEMVVHGWDLARATGQEFRCTTSAAEQTNRIVLDTAEETRSMGMFGPPVPVADSASALHRALGSSGRDPQWSV